MAGVITAFLVAMLVGIPIAFTVGISGVTHMFLMGKLNSLSIIPQKMLGGVNVFSLMCIPFFVLAGELMNKGGITKILVDFMRECVGWFRGGLAYVVVLVAIILSAILGSANAVAAILCTAVVPELIRDGYDDDFSACLVAGAGVLGPIVPPSVSFILFGVLTGASIKGLFMAGILPGLIIGLSYMLVVRYFTVKYNYPKSKERFDPHSFAKAFIKALPALLVPIVIVGGVLSGVFTPTESGAVAVGVAFIAGMISRSLYMKDLPVIFLRSGLTTAGIMLIVAFGNILSWTLAVDKIPARLSAGILSMTTDPSMVMLLIVLSLIVIGCVLEGFAAILIFAPVFAPLATSVGIDLVHFGVIFTVILSIGLVTPPMGMVLFVSSNISGVPLTKMNKRILPFAGVALAVSTVMAFFPEITLFIPKLLE